MREYLPTTEGETLAVHTGVAALADRLYEVEYDRRLPVLAQLTYERYGWDDSTDTAVQAAIRASRQKLRGNAELRAFDQALAIDPEAATWRIIGDYEADTLFPVRAVTPFTPASDEDRLILSGVVGISLTNFKQRCPLLARSRYQEFGFPTFTEACAFVGGYVVGRVIDLERQRLLGTEPSFQYAAKGVVHTVSVGGTPHGDFRMTEIERPHSAVISPLQTATKFAPPREFIVSGYHSVEPAIVASLIEAEFLRAGRHGARELVDELLATLPAAGDAASARGVRLGAFADYGDGDISFSLSQLRALLSLEGYVDVMKCRQTLHSTPYLPQSSTKFEIVLTDDGVQFRNRDDGQLAEARGIPIDREHYADFFRVLIAQTAGGLGRTAPTQLVELLVRAQSLLDGRPDEA